MQSKVHVSRSNRAFLSPTRENGSGSRTEKGAIRAGNVDFEPLGVLCLVTSARSKGKTPKSNFVERSGVARSVRGS